MYELLFKGSVRTFIIHFVQNGKTEMAVIVFFSIFVSRMDNLIRISTKTELIRFPSDRLMFISAEANYSMIHLEDGFSYLVAYQIGQLEDMITDQLGEARMHFLRIERSLIVNTNFILLIDTAEKKLIISNCRGQSHELSASREALIQVKYYLESHEQLQ